MDTLMIWWLRWLCGWADIVDGVCWVVTLGVWRPDAAMRVERWLLDWTEKRR
jgi:hypothetical protein